MIILVSPRVLSHRDTDIYGDGVELLNAAQNDPFFTTPSKLNSLHHTAKPTISYLESCLSTGETRRVGRNTGQVAAGCFLGRENKKLET